VTADRSWIVNYVRQRSAGPVNMPDSDELFDQTTRIPSLRHYHVSRVLDDLLTRKGPETWWNMWPLISVQLQTAHRQTLAVGTQL
jgi:hypothetical protein